MRTIALVAFGAILGVWQAQDLSDLNFADTMKWIRNFTTMHGVAKERGKVAQEHKMLSAGGCDVHVTHLFRCAGKSSHSIKFADAFIGLQDLDPEHVHFEEIHYEGNTLFRIDFESAKTIEQTIELADGERTTMELSFDYLNFDSRESADEFVKTLVHAITLCGGKPATF
jgi:hypothetical protein